jgi:threonine/homoserine/homoserine lactone efflux protein
VAKQIHDSGHKLHPCGLVQIVVEVPDFRDTAFRYAACVDDRMRDKRQRPAAERFLDQAGVDIDDPVDESLSCSRAAIMRLVRMQDVELAGQAVPFFVSEPERLNTGQRHPDRIGVMPVGRKRLAVQMRLHALDALGSRSEPDTSSVVSQFLPRSPFAQSFKTRFVRSRHSHAVSIKGRFTRMAIQAVLPPDIWRPAGTLILASVVIMGSPGPSPLSAMAVGAAYGFRRSLTYTSGLILGTIAVLFAVAIGLVAVLLSIPHGAPLLLAVSTIYILYLSFRIATAPPLASRRDVAAPAFGGGFLLAIANPKAYLAIAAVFAGTSIIREDQAFDAAIKIGLLIVMIVVIHLCWLLAGASLCRVLQNPTASRIVNISLAACLVVTTAAAVLR